jgi:ribosome maturation factor RimP
MSAVSRQRVRDALEPVVVAAGYDLEDVTVTAAGRRSVVRVVVDRDGGVDLDAVADISRVISTALDEGNLTGDAPYTLEVSSPGVDRPLTEPRHWRRAAGRLVRVSAAGATLTARIVAADDEAVRFATAGDERRVAYADLGPGQVQVEFARADDPS